ncbi:hypothetical protein EJ994_15120 [Maribacter sp. MJ134]|uniref:hypothetical protein n=1 Tax=Maribacter sp. MJ134 TaxID=2496865 RepID=UPI000F83A42D|nr:hypothetical protein [Maribacter sp. MJ134]AZQ60064.1 hypothetical protein EJ994_15120 [Maribacter sp. MJ134]
MKTKKFILLAGIGILLQSCFSYDDEGGTRYVELQLTDAFNFENDKNYSVGDTIFVELNFSRYLEEEGFSNLLDVYESTDSEEFFYPLELLKYSAISDSYVFTEIADRFIFAEKGTVEEFYGATARLNDARDTYESRIGIILAEEGSYRLNSQFFDLQSKWNFDKVSIEIIHQFSDKTQEDFEFVVSD